jgi:hypothetical protein
VNAHLLGLKAGRRGGVGAVRRLKLGAGPDVTLIPGQRHQTVQRLHRRVGEVRHLVAGGQPGGGAPQRGVRVALAPRRTSGRRRELGVGL